MSIHGFLNRNVHSFYNRVHNSFALITKFNQLSPAILGGVHNIVFLFTHANASLGFSYGDVCSADRFCGPGILPTMFAIVGPLSLLASLSCIIRHLFGFIMPYMQILLNDKKFIVLMLNPLGQKEAIG